MSKTLLVIFLLLIYESSLATGEPFPIGAKSWGMGNATVAIADRFSIFNNPAGLGFLKENYISTSYDSRFEVIGLSTVSFSGNYASKFATFGLSFQRFGDKLYNENLIGFGIGKATERVSLGFKVNYFQAAIDNISDKKTLLTEFGVMAKLTSKVQMGFHAYNLTGANLYANQRIPTMVKFGLNFSPTKQILLAAEVEKNVDFQPSDTSKLITKLGLEYEVIPQFFFRTGFSSQLRTSHFGLGFVSKNIYFDYAASTNQALGLSHHIGLSYRL